MDEEKVSVKIQERETNDHEREDEEREERRREKPPSIDSQTASILSNFEAALKIYDAIRRRLPTAPVSPSSTVPIPMRPPLPMSTVINRAQAALINFNPTRVPDTVREDPTYLKPGSDLKVSQQAIIKRRLNSLTDPNVSHASHAIQLAITPELTGLLSNVQTVGGTQTASIDLKDLISHVEGKAQGTEIFAMGYPPFESLAAEIEAQSRVKKIIGNGGSH